MHKLYSWLRSNRYSKNFKELSTLQKVKANGRYLLAILAFFLISFLHPALFVIAIFGIIDYVRNIIKCIIRELPIDTSFFFLVLASFFFSPLLGMFIYFLGLINRAIFGHVEARHLSKSGRMVIIAFLTSVLDRGNFLYVSIFMLILNEIMQITWDFVVTRDLNLNTFLYYILHIPLSVIGFLLMDQFKFLLIR